MPVSPKKNLLRLDRISNESLDRKEYLRLDKNENLKGFSRKIMEDINKRFTSDFLTAYPDPNPLYKKLAKYLDTPKEKIYLSAGSDIGIRTIFEVFVDSKDEVIIIHPTYAMYYVYSQMFDARLIQINFDENLTLPAERIIEKIIKVASEKNALVLIDEAYFQFWGNSAIDLVSNYDNLIIVRTFSKALGLASVRLGYLVSTSEIVSHLFRVRPMYEVNSFAVSLGLYMLEHPNIAIEYINEIAQSRKWLQEELSKDGIKIAVGFANFVLIDVGKTERAAQIAEYLLKEKIVIKGGFRETGMAPYIRVGLGTMKQMKYFLEKFRKAVKTIK